MDAGTTDKNLTPFYQDELITLYCGDALTVLRQLPENLVQTCVTSPPYYGLRNYQVDGQIGLEENPKLYLIAMANVFRQVNRVLRKDGTTWLNMGDSYNSSNGGSPNGIGKNYGHSVDKPGTDRPQRAATAISRQMYAGLKPKDLIGMPWRLAFTLQEMGWWLRQDIIWSKPNPMPESVRDRCTKAHEYLFLLSKAAGYFFDMEAIKEPCGWNPAKTKYPDGWDTGAGSHGSIHRKGREKGRVVRSGNKARKNGSERGCPDGTGSNVCGSVPWEGSTRNRRSVWTISTKPFKRAHFATFPPDLIEPCIKAGTSEKGQCERCGSPLERQVSIEYSNPGNRSTNGPRSAERKHIEYGSAGFEQRLQKHTSTDGWKPTGKGRDRSFARSRNGKEGSGSTLDSGIPQKQTIGWTEQCCDGAGFVPQIVLDPFAGAGTTLIVAKKLGRRAIGIELNPDYCQMIVDRIKEMK